LACVEGDHIACKTQSPDSVTGGVVKEEVDGAAVLIVFGKGEPGHHPRFLAKVDPFPQKQGRGLLKGKAGRGIRILDPTKLPPAAFDAGIQKRMAFERLAKRAGESRKIRVS
jgi:hypothetical protein